jgi:ferredoxin
MKIMIHTDKCLSCGMCTAIAPDLFSIDNGTVSLKKDPSTYSEAEKKLAHEAAASCPNGVIEITEA